MKLLNLLAMIFVCSLLFACQNNAQDTGAGYTNPYGTFQTAQFDNNTGSDGKTLEMKPVRDSKTGRVVSYLPLPKDWKMGTMPSGIQGIEGPSSIRVSSLPTELYYFNVDSYTAQMAGMQVANPVSLEVIFKENIVPHIQQQGGKLLKRYSLDKTAQRSKELMQSALNRSSVQQYNMLASEWQQPDGSKSLILITQMIMHSQGASTWSFGMTELEAPGQYFEDAVATYLFAQANWEVDYNTAMAHAAELNRMDKAAEQRMADSRAAHQKRMRSDEEAFQNTQKIHRSTSDEISDMSMRSYWSRSDMESRMHSKEMNMIREEYTLTNPWSNKSLQVNSGYQNYFINANGDIIGSNDVNFDPNVHKNYNHTQWKPMSGGGY